MKINRIIQKRIPYLKEEKKKYNWDTIVNNIIEFGN